ncbi:aminotransferase class I/II-fold pyridoxal phosphate-dependent enzyme, partial [uncultured Amnibacterium sp.]|uniref:aminotransferase class I/II-fold pyridoxal phosphate-dependent enzyme n=1 Tax=uncultured Amnibacterium sp. TaxID=1631851 RepID=UPI0035CBD563
VDLGPGGGDAGGRVVAAGGGRRIGVEALSLPVYGDALRGAGLATEAMALDSRGADPTGLHADAALLTPAHQFPTGVVLAPDRRRAFAEAARSGLLVVEDDYDGEFRYDREPVGALQALAPDDVVYAGTASKTLAPALRLGWVVLPARLVEAFAAATDGPPPSIDQLALAALLASGGYDAHVRRMRTVYRRRRDRLLAALASAPVRVEGVAAGLHALVRLPAGVDEEAVVAAAADRGLALEGLRQYRVPGAPAPGPGLVVGYATPPAHRFDEAVDVLAQVLRRTT